MLSWQQAGSEIARGEAPRRRSGRIWRILVEKYGHSGDISDVPVIAIGYPQAFVLERSRLHVDLARMNGNDCREGAFNDHLLLNRFTSPRSKRRTAITITGVSSMKLRFHDPDLAKKEKRPLVTETWKCTCEMVNWRHWPYCGRCGELPPRQGREGALLHRSNGTALD